jgi:hypothetical protein
MSETKKNTRVDTLSNTSNQPKPRALIHAVSSHALPFERSSNQHEVAADPDESAAILKHKTTSEESEELFGEPTVSLTAAALCEL